MPNHFIPIMKPLIGEDEAQAAARPIMSGWLTQGQEVAAFEREFALEVGAQYACAVSSCTTALHVALLACGVVPGSEVITVSHSFIATANSIRYCGAKPIFVDIDSDTYNINVDLIERAIGENTKAILCVHQMGMPCDISAILKLSKRHNLPVIEDAACAAGSEINVNGQWERVGKPHGTVACFSFHPRKLLCTGDGGMLTTNDADLDQQFRLMRQHGMSIPDTVRHSAQKVVTESYVVLGYNYRMTDVQAAVGRVQLKRLPEILERRRDLVVRYRELLASIRSLMVPKDQEWSRSNWQSFCVRLPEWADQRFIMQQLLDEGVATRRGIMCVHREPAYPRGTWSCTASTERCQCRTASCVNLHVSEESQDHSIILPLFHELTEKEQEHVCSALSRALMINSTQPSN